MNSNADALSRAPVCGGEDPSETTDVQVAQVSAASEIMQQPPVELRELQLAYKEVGPMLLYMCCVDQVRDHFRLLEGVLYYVDPFRNDRTHLVLPVKFRNC